MAFQKTIKALRKGATNADAAKTLKGEMAEQSKADFDSKMAELRGEADRQAEAEKAATEAEAAEVQHLTDLTDAETELAEAARAMDQALAGLGAAFENLEAAENKIGQLDAGRRSDVLMRRWTLTRALWHHARPFCMRMKLAAPPGGPRKNAPLIDIVAKPQSEAKADA